MTKEVRFQGFFQVGGNLGPDARSYVVRRADEELPGLILADHFCYVLTSRQMGKSSLMVRTAEKLQAKGIRTAEVDLTFIGTQMPAEAWYLSFISQIHGQLGLSIDFEAWWDTRSKLSAVQRFSDFLRQVVLEEISGKVVIFIDEIETTLSLDFSDDFFAAIRAVYNARASDPAYGRLTFVLLGVAMPGDLIEDRTRTPFNIGQGVTLQEFSQEEGAVLQKGLESACPGEGEAIFTRIYHWTEGHPYLTQKLCAAAVAAGDGPWDEGRVDALVEESFFGEEALRKDSNLQMIRDRTRTDPSSRQLLRLYRQVWEGKEVRDEERSVAKSRLKLYGLVKATRGGMLTVRNRVYEQVFDLDWVKEVMPRDRARWLTAVSVLVAVVAMAITGYLLIRQRQQTAEFYIEQFLASSSADVRVTSLAGLIGLTGYEDEVHSLFFEELGHEERIAMFEVSSPAGLEDELLSVVKGLYTQLDNTSRDNSVLEAMKDTLEELDDPRAINTATEIEQWLRGRAFYNEGQYKEAASAYTLAIDLNDANASTHLDRASAYAGQGAYENALADLMEAKRLDGTREDEVRRIVNQSAGLFTYLGLHRQQHQEVAALFPTLTPTMTSSLTPTATATSSATLTQMPTLPASQSATVTPSTTSRPTFTRNPTHTPTHTPTTTPSPRPTPSKTSTPAPKSARFFTDDFSDPDSGWPVFDKGWSKAEYGDGQYHLIVNRHDYFDVWYPDHYYTDFILDVDISIVSGEGSWGGTGGVILGGDGDERCTFVVTRLDQEYSLDCLDHSAEKWVRVGNVRLHPALNPPDLRGITTNHLSIHMKRRSIAIYANGYLLLQGELQSYSGGLIGFQAKPGGQDVHVSFDNFQVGLKE